MTRIRALSRIARTSFLVGALALALPALAGTENPAPANKLQGYSGYELKPVTLNSELAGKKNIEKVTAKVDDELKKNVGAVLNGWTPDSANAQKIVIEPHIESLHKPSGATRFFAGAAAGAGRILLKVKITEQPSGKVIGEPEFYRHANAMAGAWTMGAHDNAMLEKVTQLLANYLTANYTTTTTTQTGFEP
jgi:hypothetical protein